MKWHWAHQVFVSCIEYRQQETLCVLCAFMETEYE